MECGDNGIGPEQIVQLLQERGYHTVWDNNLQCHVHSLPLHLPHNFKRRSLQVCEYRDRMPCSLFEIRVVFETRLGAWSEHKLYGLPYGALYSLLPELEKQCLEIVLRYGKKRSDPD